MFQLRLFLLLIFFFTSSALNAQTLTISSSITITADQFDLTSGIGFNTSGTLTIRPTTGNSFTSTFKFKYNLYNINLI